MKVIELRCDENGCDAKIGAVAGQQAEEQLHDLASHRGWWTNGCLCYCAGHRPPAGDVCGPYAPTGVSRKPGAVTVFDAEGKPTRLGPFSDD